MNFDFKDDEKRLFETIRAIAGAAPSEEILAGQSAEAVSRTLRDILNRLAEAGYLQLGFGKNAKADAVPLMGAMETLAGQARSLFLAVEMSTRVLGRAIAHWADSGQKEQWLQSLLAGNWLGALALSEDTMNVENDPLTTRGVRKDGRVLVSGRKQYVVNGPLADRIGAVGMLDGKLAIFMIDRQAEGLSVSDRIRTMGYDGLHIAEIGLHDCDLSEADVILPPENAPVLDLLRLWENEILLAAALGLMQASLAEARDFAKSHRSGGKPVIAYQEVGFKLSEMLTLYQTAQLLAYRAVWTMATQPKEGASLIWCAKVFSTEAAERVAGEALRILAGQGYRFGSASESAYRAAKWTQISGISTEIARVKIGDQALGYR
jgi:alkylation response protein AidB-like acyl-CoA dehydrogenase